MEEKQIGYALLGIGITVMFLSAVIVLLTFTGIIKPVSLFNIPAPTLNTGSFMPQIPGLPKSQGTDIEIFPTESFNLLLNISVMFFLMTFLMSFGFKLADLGVKLLRPIKVK